jgi:hypothetical protein
MKQHHIAKGVWLIMALLFTGCASYSPSLVRLEPSGPSTSRQASGDLLVYVDEYATPEKSQRAFDTNLIKEGVLALLIQVQNSGQQPYEVKAMDIVVQEGDHMLRGLTPEQAGSKAKRNAVSRAIGWSLIVPIISIPVAVAASAIHTNKVNKQILQDFSAKGFPDGTITPNKERSGFVFFELPKGRRDLSGLLLQIKARNETTDRFITIATPLPSSAFKPIKESPSEEEEKE